MVGLDFSDNMHLKVCKSSRINQPVIEVEFSLFDSTRYGPKHSRKEHMPISHARTSTPNAMLVYEGRERRESV